MKKKLEVITKVSKRKCYFCEDRNKDCKVCGGTGIHEDKTYIFIVDGKYAYSADTLK